MIPPLPLPLPDPRLRRIRMHQRAQRAPPNTQPRDERAELRGRKQVHLEHGRRVGSDGLVPHAVDAELGELAPDALPELLGVEDLGGVLGEVVDVDVAEGGGGVVSWSEG